MYSMAILFVSLSRQKGCCVVFRQSRGAPWFVLSHLVMKTNSFSVPSSLVLADSGHGSYDAQLTFQVGRSINLSECT